MEKPTLVIMAAGLGSRYGGLKQMDPVGSAGEILLDFSMYDAMMAGFERVVFVIKHEIEADFKALIQGRADKYLDIEYAYQEIADIPSAEEIFDAGLSESGLVAPGTAGTAGISASAEELRALRDRAVSERKKPWGTGQAVLAAKELIRGPFAVINSDDYYGPQAFMDMYEFLEKAGGGERSPGGSAADMGTANGAPGLETAGSAEYAMAAYLLKNTLSENGGVSRGICTAGEGGRLSKIVETHKLARNAAGEIWGEPSDGSGSASFPEDTLVSMNFWGFSAGFMDELSAGFPRFLSEALGDSEKALKAEYPLPTAVDAMISEGRASVRLLPTADRWYGVTYKEDKRDVVDALQAKKDKGEYPDKLWK